MFKNTFKSRALKILMLIFLVSGIGFVGDSNASEVDIFERFKKDMPEIAEMDKEEFISKTRPIKDTPYNQKSLAYSIRIPKDWIATQQKSSGNFVLSEKLFLELNRFYGPASPFGRSRIEIEALNLDTNLTVEQWYLKYILEAGMTTEGLVVHNRDRVESLVVAMDGEFSYYLRTLVVRNENKVIMAKYYVPVSFMQQEASMQQAVIGSFQILYQTERKQIDSNVYRFLDVAEVRYPKTWEVFSKPMRAVDYMDAALINVEGGRGTSSSSNGKVDITVVLQSDKRTLIEEIAAYKKKIQLNGLLVGDKIKGYGDFNHSKEMDFGISEVYRGIDSTNNQSEYEFWFSVLVGGNYYYLMMLLTPSRNDNFSIWANNVQNYHFILENFQPMSGAYLERQ